MKNVAVALLLVGFIGSVASAATVGFDAPETVLNPGDSRIVEMTLTVTEAAGAFDALNIKIGSDDLTITNFTPDIVDVFVFPGFLVNKADTSVYPSGWVFGYFGTESNTPNAQMLGTLTVDTTGLADGTYTVQINPERDNGFSALGVAGVADLVSGLATITIVPEPATLALLGIGGVATVLRRRRTA